MSSPTTYRQEIDTLFSRVTIVEQLIQTIRPMIPIINQMRTDLEHLRVNSTTNKDNIVLLTEDFGELDRRLAPVEADVAELRQRVSEERHRWELGKRSREQRSSAPSPPSPIQPPSPRVHTARRSRERESKTRGRHKLQRDSRMPNRYRKKRSRKSSLAKTDVQASSKTINKLGELLLKFVGLRRNVVQRPLRN